MTKTVSPPGETEMEILHHVWDIGEATGNDVLDRIRKTRNLAYTTVITVLKNLVKKGYLKYRKEGRTYIYSAAMEPDSVRRNLVNDLVRKVFKGSSSGLIQMLVEKEDLSPDQITEIINMIHKLEDY